jgi:hypothetical protein
MSQRDFQVIPASDIANAKPIRRRNFRDRVSNRERSYFDCIVTRPGGKGEGIFQVPILKDFIADREPHYS